ncbi:MAG: hypothetical protein C0627_00840 [Sulfurimonas sp.]|nr:MAG: hypothetical protein C0627_00840 [Sulfurimonas sp.]
MDKRVKLYILNKKNSYHHCVVLEPFRIFYNLSDDEKTPKVINYSYHAQIPNYIIDLMRSFYGAYNIFTKIYKLDDPLKKGIYHEKGAKFIDIMLAQIPVQKGLVAAELVDNYDMLKDDVSMQGSAIRVLLDNNLIKNTATPIHELFHIFQYSYCSFNNMWFMEGLARWAQNITHTRKDEREKLPQNKDELEALIKRAHDAEHFWRRLIKLVGDERLFIKRLLDNCVQEAQGIEKIFASKNRYKKNAWNKDEKKHPLNNKYIFKAIIDSLKECSAQKSSELDIFLEVLSDNIYTKAELFNTPQIQQFLKTLQKIDANTVHEDSGILYCDNYDTKTKTLTMAKLKCIELSEYELESLNAIEHLSGDLIISSSSVKNLNSFNSLKSVENLYITNSKNMQTLNGFNTLETLNALEISKNNSLADINGFNILCKKESTINDFIKITHNKKLRHVEFLNGLKVVNSSFYLHHNALVNLKGLENLQEVGASFSLSSNNLNDISALSKLKTVKGMLGLAYNNLSSLKGLENLKHIYTTKWNGKNRTLAIHDNPNLHDISALENVLNDEDYYIIVLIDSYLQYTKKPSVESNFHKNILELYESQTRRLIPTYKFVSKPTHDYKNFGKTTHSTKLTHMFDFELESDILIISFSGLNGWLGGMFNSRYPFIIGEMVTNKIFIMDKSDSWYHNGIDGLTSTMEETIEFIKNITVQKKYSKIICTGASMGGYMALLIGRLIGATNIVAFSPQTFLDEKNRKKYGDTRWSSEINKLNKPDIDKKYFDLKELYKETFDDTKIEIHYSKQIKLDEIHAKHLDNKKIKLIGYDDADHYIAVYLHKKGALEKIILKNLGMKRVKILFGDKWQKAVSKCKWLEAHHLNFKDIKSVITYCKNNEIKILFANNYTTQIEILKNEDLLRKNGLMFIVNKKETLQNFVDKQKFYDIMTEHNMSEYVPKYYSKSDDIKYPCMIKIKAGGAGRGVFLAYSKKDLKDISDDMIISEYLSSDTEYATSIFYKDGKILKDITFSKKSNKDIYILQQENKKDILTKREETRFLDIFKSIIEIFTPKGEYCQCSINYKIEDNKPKIFEINPRIGYTLAGFCDDFKDMIEVYLHETVKKQQNNDKKEWRTDEI